MVSCAESCAAWCSRQSLIHPLPSLTADDEVSPSAPTAKAATDGAASASGFSITTALATTNVPKVHVVTAEDVAASKYSVFDVVLPLPGFAIQYPAGKVGDCYRDIMRADRLDPDNMFRKQK